MYSKSSITAAFLFLLTTISAEDNAGRSLDQAGAHISEAPAFTELVDPREPVREDDGKHELSISLYSSATTTDPGPAVR